MKTEKIARFISIVLGPHVWLPVLMTIILLRANLTFNQLLILFPTLFAFEVVVPLLYIHYAVKKGVISAWDMPKRQERFHFSAVMLFTTIISLLLVYHNGNQQLFTLTLSIFLLSLVLAVITLFWKISIHASLNTLGALLINYLFAWQFIWLFLTIPIIFWSRLYLKRHNIVQLVAGTLVTLFVIWLFLNLTSHL